VITVPVALLSAGPIDDDDTGGDGPVVVLLHGLLMDATVWRPVVDRLAPRHRCLTPTLPLGSHRRPTYPDADLSLVMPRAHGPRLADLYPDGRLVEIPDSRTLVPVDRPAELAAVIDGFVAAS
jgi:pimeloyl-ACP methyl ester carboxylesterase